MYDSSDSARSPGQRPDTPDAAPDPNVTSSGSPLPSSGGAMPDKNVRGRETQERDAARQRGRERRARRDAGHDPEVGRADPALVHRAFATLAENVRDYAIFLMDADGVIRFWGEGAHLIKRWNKEETEGAHLRMLYVDGGSEDGTAEEHLREAAARGESVSEGHRVRGDGSTFWARITLTALRDEAGTLIGFAKVTIDLTTQRVADATRTLQRLQAEESRWQRERAELSAEVAVLAEENAVLRQELQGDDAAGDDAAGGDSGSGAGV